MSNRRSMTDFPRNEAGLVDEFIGTAYDTVKNVYDTLPEIQRLDDVLEEIPQLAENTVNAAVDSAMVPVIEELNGKVSEAEAWAQGSSPDPEDPTAKSAKEWAEESEASKEAADSVVEAGSTTIQQVLTEAQDVLAQVQVAGDAAQLSAGVYKDTTEGLLKTTDGEYFSVPSDLSAEYLILYLNSSGVAVEQKRYPSAEAISSVNAELIQATTTMNKIAPFAWGGNFDQRMPVSIGDKNRNPIWGINRDGTVHAILKTMPGLPALSNYRWAMVDRKGVILIGVKWSGEIVLYNMQSEDQNVFAAGPDGGQDIFVVTGGQTYQLSSSGGNFGPYIKNGIIKYMQSKGYISLMTALMPSVGSFAPFINKLIHIISFGQSLAMGSGSVPATTVAPVANRLFTLNDGVRLANQDGTLTAEMVAPFKPLVAKTTEPSCVQLAAQLNRTRGVPANAGLLVSLHGRGGYTIAQLSKGTLYYSNMMTAITNAKLEADRLGYAYEVPFMHWRQGEADRNAVAGVYLASMLQLQADFEADVNAITGRTDRIPMLVEQISNVTSYAGVVTSNVVFEQLQASIDYPDRFICTGPSYNLGHLADGTHMLAPEYQRLGCNNASAASGVINGGRFQPLMATRATRNGLKVTVEFYVPHGPLVLDTKNVTDPKTFVANGVTINTVNGLRWVDSQNSAKVVSLRLVGNNAVELTLDVEPTGSSPYVGIGDIGVAGNWGGPTTGMRTNLRDSSNTADGFGHPLYNWACHQRINVN